jgi:iron complex transport system permease protein
VSAEAITAHAVVRTGRVRARRHAWRAGAGLLALLVAVLAVGLSAGEYPVPLADVLPAVFGGGGSGDVLIVQELRLPRALVGVLVGAALGLSGAMFQTVVRNPLGSPDILGITYGGGLAAVAAITVFSASYAVIAVAACAGALVFSALVYALAFRRGVSAYRFILVGIGLGSAASAATQFMVTRASRLEAAEVLLWLTGSLNAVGRETLVPLAIALAALIPLALLLAGRLNALSLGDDTAVALGTRVERSRLAVLVVAVALVGVAIAAAGPVAFVAFMAGPIARRLTRAPLPLVPAALTGAIIVVGADVAGRLLFAPSEIPVGIFTGALGAPFLLWLLAKANRAGSGG